MRTLDFLKTFNSPFKRPKLKWYFGKTAVGTPFFYPRRWVKDPQNPRYQKPVPKRIGFDFVGLGWKTKWTETDYRFEWSPVFSFVFFGYQIAVSFEPPEYHHYWEAWLYYEKSTSKLLSKEDRIKKCIKEFPMVYTVSSKSETKTINYYELILKEKYLKFAYEF
jgi:hypothetical protein